ncbi:MAG: surface-adhesin E family protein, partial [Pseudomonadota bacterium]
QSLVEVDCAQHTERVLQRTFFSDKHWEDPAMKTDTKPKRKRPIKEGSAAERLSAILCDP